MNKDARIETKKFESDSLSLLDVLMILLKWKKRILLITAIVCLVSIILYFFVFELIYFSSASIKSSGKSAGLLGNLDVDIGGLSGGLDEFGLGGGKSAKELAGYEEILTSRRCIEPLIIKFDLINKDKFTFMEDAYKSFTKSNLVISYEKLAGVMSVGVFYKDPVIAKEMVEFLLDELDKINIELSVLNAKNNREFVEKRYLQAKEDLTRSEDSLKSYQLIYGLFPDLQFKAAAQSVFTLEAELKTEEVKLDVLKKILSPEQVEIKTQEAKINSIRNRVAEIENSTDVNDFLRLGNSPQIAMNFLRLQREVEIQSKIVSYLLPVYEQAKIEENKLTPTILILDKPAIAERKTKPKRLTMVILLTVVGFALTSVYLIAYEKFKYLKSEIKLRGTVI